MSEADTRKAKRHLIAGSLVIGKGSGQVQPQKLIDTLEGVGMIIRDM